MMENYCECDCHKGDRMCQVCRAQEEAPCAIAAKLDVEAAIAGNRMAQTMFTDARRQIHLLTASGWEPSDALSVVLTGLCGALVMSLTHMTKMNDGRDPHQVAHEMVDALWGIKPSSIEHAGMN